MKRTLQKASSKWRISAVLLALGMASVATTLTQAALVGTDVGGPAGAGSVELGSGTITIKGGGNDIWGTSDQFYYYYEPKAADFDVSVKVDSITPDSAYGGNNWAKAELMVRVPSAAGAAPVGGDPFLAAMQNPDLNGGVNTVGDQRRQNRGVDATSGPEPGNQPLPTWLRMTRAGAIYTLFYSLDGTAWTTISTVDTSTGWDPGFASGAVYVGLAVTAHADGGGTALNTVVFSELKGLGSGVDEGPFASATGYAGGFNLRLVDGEQNIASAVTSVKLDGVEVRGQMTLTKTGNAWTGYWTTTSWLESGSTHSLEVTATVAGSPVIRTATFPVAAWNLLPAAYALGGTPTGAAGISIEGYQIASGAVGNTIGGAEQAWARGFIDPATKLPYDNLVFADDFGPANPMPYINVSGRAFPGWPGTDKTEEGSFRSTTTPAQADVAVPGIPGNGTATVYDNVVYKFTAVLDLPVGFYRMVVNSDDGFKLTAGMHTNDVNGFVLASYNGGKGASDITGDFVTEAAGKYIIRLLWYQGGGDVNCEWFTVNPQTGVRALIRDVKDAEVTALAAVSTSAGVQTRAHVSKVLPAADLQVAETNTTVSITLANGTASTVVAAQTRLLFDGVQVVTGASSTVNYVVPAKLAFNSQHTSTLIWTESGTPNIVHTNDFTFRVRSFSLGDVSGPGTFVIEIEDFDYERGKSVAAANTMPYLGGAYAGLQSIDTIDYHTSGDPGDGTQATDYRVTYGSAGATTNRVGMSAENDNNNLWATTRPGIVVGQTYTTTNNFKIGWGGTHWFNYTRTIPKGVYTGIASSSRDTQATFQHSLSIVDSGAGTVTQTVRELGMFRGSNAGRLGWSVWCLMPMTDANGNSTYFKLPGGPVTLRYTQVAESGDMNFFALVPTATAAPQLKGVSPVLDLPIRRNATITWQVEEFSAPLNPSSIVLKINNITVNPIVTPDASTGIWSIAWLQPTLYDTGKQYTWSLAFADTSGNAGSNTGTFMANYLPNQYEGAFVIEAEDFNFGSGQTKPAASVMPYAGGAYEMVEPIAVTNIDYAGPREPTDPVAAYNGWLYRTNMVDLNPNVPMSARMGTGAWGYNTLRAQYAGGDYTMTTNHAIGWAATSRWFNYSRTVPAAKYQVWAGMSYGGRGTVDIRATLGTVGDVSTSTQNVTPLGVFRSPGSGGWGDTILVPMWDAATTNTTAALEVQLGGAPLNLRMNLDSGDFDYLVLVPMEQIPGGTPAIESAAVVGGQLRITFSGGTLESTASLPATSWTGHGTASPQDFPMTGTAQFFRVRN